MGAKTMRLYLSSIKNRNPRKDPPLPESTEPPCPPESWRFQKQIEHRFSADETIHQKSNLYHNSETKKVERDGEDTGRCFLRSGGQ
jgi:hypothetical protein